MNNTEAYDRQVADELTELMANSDSRAYLAGYMASCGSNENNLNVNQMVRSCRVLFPAKS